MADKITDLTELTTLAAGDYFAVVDVSDTTQAATGTTKKIQKTNVPCGGGSDTDLLNTDLNNIKLADFNDWVDNGNSGAADTIDFTTGNGQKSTLTADCTYTFTDPISTTGWTRLQLKIVQDVTGGWDITWPAEVIWDGTEPTWTDGTSNQIMYVTFVYDAERDKYIGSGTSWSS